MEMTSRERMLTALRRQEPDRVPRIIEFECGAARAIAALLNIKPEELRQHFKVDMDFAFLNPTRLKNDYSRYYTRPGVEWDEWGRGRLWDATRHHAEYLYPLQDCETVAEIEAYPWPDLSAPYRAEGLADRVAVLHDQGQAVFGAMGDTIWEMAWQLRSMDRVSEDLLLESDIAGALLEKITERRIAMARAYARAGVDFLHLADDLATQTGPLLGVALYERWLKPCMVRIVDAAREIKPDVMIHYHSDGNMTAFIPTLLDIGVDVINPVQPECINHQMVTAEFGNRVAFSGGLGVQTVLPFGTPEEVREHVRATLETLGRNGGLVIGPAHLIERDMPFENVMAMQMAIDEFGRY